MLALPAPETVPAAGAADGEADAAGAEAVPAALDAAKAAPAEDAQPNGTGVRPSPHVEPTSAPDPVALG